MLHAKEALKEYQCTVSGAMGFLQQIELRLLIPSAIFKDRMEELCHTQQALTSLSEEFQTHLTEIQSRMPKQTCFSNTLTEKLHNQVVSRLLVDEAILKAQAQLKQNALQR